ncbi:MAG TPA: RHS repeat-associated core domain-containing protein [Terriglobales bacterium]|nr:RHS repeat-associated core domain-containing protein [Terriglobales bacterium]
MTGITYGSGDSDVLMTDPNLGFVTGYTYNIGSSQIKGVLNWNTNNTLQKLTVTDPLNSQNQQTCTYTHDDLTRLATNNCGSGFSQTFSYDQYGNISIAGSNSFQPTYNPSNNRWSAIGSITPTYNANGDLETDGTNTYTWDTDGHMLSANTSNTATYDALGRLLEFPNSSGYQEVVYAPTGAPIGIQNGSTNVLSRFPLVGGAKAVYTGSVLSYYSHPDFLGSVRLTTSPTKTALADLAYSPFGQPYNNSGVPNSVLTFTGNNQDVAPGTLYDFPAREYNPNQSRWISPDPHRSTNFSKPQDLNRYAYSRNSPLENTDPTGLCPPDDDNQSDCPQVPNAFSYYTPFGQAMTSPDFGQIQVNNPFDLTITASLQFSASDANTLGSNTLGGNPSLMGEVGAGYGLVEDIMVSSIANGVGGAALNMATDAAAGAISDYLAARALPTVSGGSGAFSGVPVSAGEEFVTVYHGSVDNYKNIALNGLDVEREGTTYASTSEAAAIDATKYALPNWRLAANNRGVVQSAIPKQLFDTYFAPFQRPYAGFYGPGGYELPPGTTEILMQHTIQKEIFNWYMIRPPLTLP